MSFKSILPRFAAMALLAAIATAGAREADPLSDLEELLSRESHDLARARHLLLIMKEKGAAFLSERIKSEDYRTATKALEVLCYGFGGDSTEEGKEFVRRVMPSLLECLTSDRLALRSRALWLVGTLGAKAEPAVDLLLAAAAEPESERYIIKKAAIKSLGEIHSQPEKSLPLLESLLEHDNPEVVRFAVTAIGRFESRAEFLLPRLQVLTNSPDENLSKAARQAIDRVELPPKPKPGDLAPDFNLPAIFGGKSVRLHDFRGQLVLLDFWATTCAPCLAPLAKYERLLEQHASGWNGKVAIIAIGLDEDAAIIRRHLESKRWGKVTHLWGGESEKLTRAYRIHGLPDTLLIDAKGTILWRGHPVDLNFEESARHWLSSFDTPKR